MKLWMFLQRVLALTILAFSLPFFGLLWLVVKLEDGGPLIYKQKRMGKKKKAFVMYKIRTMVVGDEKLKKKYLHLNEADGPVFKIYNDPRHTRIGRFLAHTGLDELPQLINIIKGEMAFVGPRPLPWEEAKKVPKKYQKRFSVLPGITSTWVTRGAHKLAFKGWMEADLEDVSRRGLIHDLHVFSGTVLLVVKLMYFNSKKYLLASLFFLVIFVGLLLRLKLALGRTLWADEVFYFDVANSYSFKDIVFVNHWIKDNPPLFLLFLKIWSSINKKVIWLRLPGLIIYVISARILISKLFKKLHWCGKLTILSFFALSPFFMNINYWVSPYNFVLLTALLQLNLLSQLLDGKYSKGQPSFISTASRRILRCNTGDEPLVPTKSGPAMRRNAASRQSRALSPVYAGETPSLAPSAKPCATAIALCDTRLAAFDRAGGGFIIRFSLLNLLIFNLHYSSFYFFLSYPLVLVYLLVVKKGLVKIFLLACIISGLLLLPNILFLLSIWPEFIDLMKANVTDIYFSTPVELFLYIINRSIFRLENYYLTTQVLLTLFVVLVALWMIKLRQKLDSFFLILFFSFFVASGLFLYFSYKQCPSLLTENTFSIYHLAFYFMLAFIVNSIYRVKRKFYYVFCSFLVLIAISVFLTGELRGTSNSILRGDVAFGHLSNKDHGAFVDKTLSLLGKHNDVALVTFGVDKNNHYEKYIFLNYYLVYDKRLEDLKNGLNEGDNLFNLKSGIELKRLARKLDREMVVLNFEMQSDDVSIMAFVDKPYVDKLHVVDFWSYQEGY